MSEAWVPEPAPEGPEYEAREVPLCPICKGLVRRDLGAWVMPGGRVSGPWKCDIHGIVDAPEWEELEIPARYAL